MDEKNEVDKKAQSDSEDVENKDTKKDKKEKEEKDEEKSENSEKDEEDDDNDSKKEVPLLDQPLELSGKRERKNVQRLEITAEVKEVSNSILLYLSLKRVQLLIHKIYCFCALFGCNRNFFR